MDPSGRVVVVTGGGSGIGAALCHAFAAAGAAAVVVADRDGNAARATAAAMDGDAEVVDVTVEAEVSDLVRRCCERHGRVDIYCSNAGVALAGGAEAPDEAWQASWAVHVMAHVYAARALLPDMRARGEGCLVGTVSAAGLLNHVYASPYAASKAAGLSFLEWLSIAHGDEGLVVCALCPQGVRTPMLAQAGENDFLQAGALEADEVAALVLEAVREERFLILPHPEVRDHAMLRVSDNERWLRGMRRLRQRAGPRGTTWPSA